MNKQFSRSALLYGEEAIEKLNHKRVALFGVGGVGGAALEGLARAGIGEIDVIDNDEFSLSNLNRQILSLHSTIGTAKVDIAKKRALDINPNIIIHTYQTFYLPKKKDEFPFACWDYILDCIDTVSAKLDIIEEAKKRGIPILSAMGCGNRLDPTKLVLTDIFKTDTDPLCKVMRHELRKRHISSLDIIYSTEPAKKVPLADEPLPKGKRSIPGSTPFVPSTAGLWMAYKAVSDLLKE